MRDRVIDILDMDVHDIIQQRSQLGLQNKSMIDHQIFSNEENIVPKIDMEIPISDKSLNIPGKNIKNSDKGDLQLDGITLISNNSLLAETSLDVGTTSPRIDENISNIESPEMDSFQTQITRKNNVSNNDTSLEEIADIDELMLDKIMIQNHNKGALKGDTTIVAKNPLIEKPHMQVSLAINDLVLSNKKEMTINLFPETLGKVEVKIISSVSEIEMSKIEVIKITAEKRDSLEIVEKSRIDIEKSLKEVGSMKEGCSIEFEMNKGNSGEGNEDAYFDSLEERVNWMSKFSDVISKGDGLDHKEINPKNGTNNIVNKIV